MHVCNSKSWLSTRQWLTWLPLCFFYSTGMEHIQVENVTTMLHNAMQSLPITLEEKRISLMEVSASSVQKGSVGWFKKAHVLCLKHLCSLVSLLGSRAEHSYKVARVKK